MRLIKLIIFIFFSVLICNGQEQFVSKTYILSEVQISGENNLSQKSVMTLMGLEIGKKITIPSEDLSNETEIEDISLLETHE